jgi:hypothetical protein
MVVLFFNKIDLYLLCLLNIINKLLMTTLEDIVKLGMFYFPAHKHYGHLTTVNCDRCFASNLPACIGYDKKDLCLDCAKIIINSLDKKTISPIIPAPVPTLIASPCSAFNYCGTCMTCVMLGRKPSQFTFTSPDAMPKPDIFKFGK